MRMVFLGVQLASLVRFRGPLIRELVAAGHSVTALAPEPTDEWLQALQETGAQYLEVPLARTGTDPLRDLRTFLWLLKTLCRLKPDVLFCFQAKAVIYGLLAGFMAGIKRRVAMIEGLGQGFIPGQGLKRKIVQFCVPLLYFMSLPFAHKVIFLNHDDSADFKKRWLVRECQIEHIPGIGVDLARFAYQPLPQEPFTFLMLGRLIIDKGVREYIAAARLVKAKFPETCFMYIGEPDTSHVGVAVSELEGIEYLGVVRDVRPAFYQSHVFVLPSYREGMPVASMEALAMGRPLITTDVPGARETVRDGENGLLINARDINGLAEAMIKMIALGETLGQKGQASRKLAEARFDVRLINRRITEILTGAE